MALRDKGRRKFAHRLCTARKTPWIGEALHPTGGEFPFEFAREPLPIVTAVAFGVRPTQTIDGQVQIVTVVATFRTRLVRRRTLTARNTRTVRPHGDFSAIEPKRCDLQRASRLRAGRRRSHEKNAAGNEHHAVLFDRLPLGHGQQRLWMGRLGLRSVVRVVVFFGRLGLSLAMRVLRECRRDGQQHRPREPSKRGFLRHQSEILRNDTEPFYMELQ